MKVTPPSRTMVHAIALVVAAHKARLSDATLSVAEKVARDAGATRAELSKAVARGVQASLVIGAVLLGACRPADAAPATPPSDSVFTLAPDVRIPGRLAGYSGAGVEVWDMGDFTVRVRRVAR